MNKRSLLVLMAMIALLFCGCSTTDGSLDDLYVVSEDRISVESITRLEPVESTQTESSELANEFGLSFGDEVWAVEGEGEESYLVRYAFISQHDDLVEVIPYFTSNVQQLRESMGETQFVDPDRMYFDRIAAMSAVAEACGETFEEYWGETP